MPDREALSRLRATARRADELHAQSRKLLVESARSGAAAGLSQRQIGEAIGRSQPEVSRLLRFHGHTALAQTLVSHRKPLLSLLASAGGRNVRVFGSLTRGEDGPDSDVDLLVDFAKPVGLFGLSRLEAAATEIVGAPVDVVPSTSLRTNLADSVRAEAVPL
ncbi:hypothetical protein B7R22_16295 [Subtercola boreus]|uniref:Polymerase nucleotidyl transferase domain-containing protein n=1 Tax=Subtercola boreus TaxID=120213 RepID=A0A3E0VR60_9MICO|nr:nucleotidyltransferase domain-containing protein [Subtercola boreus]RFA12356.1 hypothetical protein B7R22_16295 [Subtercola boreus]